MENREVGPDIVDKYEGQNVRAYLFNGKVLSGIAHFEGGWLHIGEVGTDKSAACNLQHVISIVKF